MMIVSPSATIAFPVHLLYLGNEPIVLARTLFQPQCNNIKETNFFRGIISGVRAAILTADTYSSKTIERYIVRSCIELRDKAHFVHGSMTRNIYRGSMLHSGRFRRHSAPHSRFGSRSIIKRFVQGLRGCKHGTANVS